jgi:flagellar biosynthesis protein FliR
MDLFTDLFRQQFFEELGYSVIAFSLLLTRLLAFVHFAPVFSHKSVPAHTKITLAFLITTMLAPRVLDTAIPLEGYSIIYEVILNFFLGFIMGFTANLLFYIVVAGGEMMDAAMGFSSGQMFDPSLGGQTTIVGRFMSMLSVVVFFYVGGPETLLQGMSNSLDTFPIYAMELDINVFRIIHLTGQIISMGFVIVSPIILTILVNDIVLGLVSRASPQINAFQISFTIKPSIGILIWLMIMPLFFTGVANLFTSTSKLF